ncbi:MAG: hypothetical protein R3B41_02075 [Candidatus Doudnabacteria bacterium]
MKSKTDFGAQIIALFVIATAACIGAIVFLSVSGQIEKEKKAYQPLVLKDTKEKISIVADKEIDSTAAIEVAGKLKQALQPKQHIVVRAKTKPGLFDDQESKLCVSVGGWQDESCVQLEPGMKYPPTRQQSKLLLSKASEKWLQKNRQAYLAKEKRDQAKKTVFAE